MIDLYFNWTYVQKKCHFILVLVHMSMELLRKSQDLTQKDSELPPKREDQVIKPKEKVEKYIFSSSGIIYPIIGIKLKIEQVFQPKSEDGVVREERRGTIDRSTKTLKMLNFHNIHIDIIIQSTDCQLHMALHNKENQLLLANHPNRSIDQTKSSRSEKKTVDGGRGCTGVRQEMLDDVRAQVYDQQRKNRKLYAQITQRNPHFAYQLHRRPPHAHHQYALLREHEQLLQEEAYLLKQLAKTECIGQIGETQKDCFAFLVQIWEGKGGQSRHSQDKIDELNKKISFLKTNVKECTGRLAGDHFAYSSSMITQSREYQEMSQKYHQSIEEFNKKEQQFNAKSLQYQEKIRHLQKKNEDLTNTNKDLQSKIVFYSVKTNDLFSKITKLTNQVAEKQRKLNEALNNFTNKYQSTQKCAQSNKPQFQLFLRNNQLIGQYPFGRVPSLVIGRSLQQVIHFIERQTSHPINDGMSFEQSEVLSQISFESMEDPLDDKENSQASITSEDLYSQSKYALSSIKKTRNSHKVRQVLFSQVKNRLSFEPSTANDIKIQQNISKPLKFLRKK